MAPKKNRVRYPITGKAGAQTGSGPIPVPPFYQWNNQPIGGGGAWLPQFTASAQAGAGLVRYKTKYRKTGR